MFTVIMQNNLTTEVEVHGMFETYEQACEFLQSKWEDEYNTLLEEFEVDEEESWHEEDKAMITLIDRDKTAWLFTVVKIENK